LTDQAAASDRVVEAHESKVERIGSPEDTPVNSHDSTLMDTSILRRGVDDLDASPTSFFMDPSDYLVATMLVSRRGTRRKGIQFLFGHTSVIGGLWRRRLGDPFGRAAIRNALIAAGEQQVAIQEIEIVRVVVGDEVSTINRGVTP
jgi:hypothetical protein